MKLELFPSRSQFSLNFSLRLVCYCALIALCIRVWQASRPCIRAAALLESFDTWSGMDATKVLNQMGPSATPFLLAELEQSDAQRQVRALGALRYRLQDAGRFLPAVLPLLEHPDAEVRAAAVRALGAIGRNDPTVPSALIHRIRDPNDAVRAELIGALHSLNGNRSDPAARKGDRDPRAKLLFCGAIQQLGQAARPAEPWLIDSLQDEDIDVRWSAARTLLMIGVTEQRAVPLLLQLLREREVAAEPPTELVHATIRDSHTLLAVFLHRQGVDAAELIPIVMADLASPKAIVRLHAAEALAMEFGQGPPSLLAARELIEHPEPYLRKRAALLVAELTNLTPKSKVADDPVTQSDRERKVRDHATRSE